MHSDHTAPSYLGTLFALYTLVEIRGVSSHPFSSQTPIFEAAKRLSDFLFEGEQKAKGYGYRNIIT